VRGTVTALNDGSVTNPTGIFTAQFAGLPYQSVPATLAGGGRVSAAYSAIFQAVVPEPATGMLVSLGVAGLLLLRRREGR